MAATEWAETHRCPADGAYAAWGEPDLYGEGMDSIAGVGAPLVAEFAPVELGAALGWTTTAAPALMGDGLELKWRLSLLYALVTAGVVPVYLGRQVALATRDLPVEAAGSADRLLTRDPARLTRARIRMLVDEARLYHDPDRAIDDEQQALAHRKVELWPGNTPATTDVNMTLDTPDADAFNQALAQTAEALKALGDDDNLDVRRAKAVGVLADPQRALDLLEKGVDPGRNKLGAGGAVLWLQLNESALHEIDTFPAPVTCDRLGTLSSDLLKMWLTDTQLTIRPVRDLNRTDAVDQHHPPESMADQVRLRDRACVFPGCHRPSQGCDLDHIAEYIPIDEGGPPGQTFPEGLAPLCRRHHRAKTHTTWTYYRRGDGGYRWTSPSGRTYDVDPPPRQP